MGHQTISEMVREKLSSAASRVSEEIGGAPAEVEKTASAGSPTGDLEKLAQQCDYVAEHLSKIAQAEAATGAGSGPGSGPGALEMRAPVTAGGPPTGGAASDPDNRTPSTGTPEMASAADEVQTPATKIKDDYASPPGAGDQLSIAGMKQAQVRIATLLRKLSASEEAPSAYQESSQGPGRGPGSLQTSDEFEPAIPPAGQPIQSTQKVIDVTQQETKAPVKQELKGVLDEPALSKSTDPVLDAAFEHTPGAKISADENLQSMARRIYLQKVASRGCTCSGQDACEYCSFIKYAQEQEQEAKGEGKEETEESEKKKKEEESDQEPSKPAAAGEAIKH